MSAELEERLAGVLVDGGDFTPALARTYAALLLPVVKGYARMEVRRFYFDAADEALKLGRRGPNSVADWLLDVGRARADEVAAS